MEIQKSSAQKFWKIARIVSQRKTIVEVIHMLLERGKTAGKAMMLHHSCRSDDVNASFVSPAREYEFSCSNTPVYPSKANYKNQHQVDRDAEEFIKNFYMDLKKQKRIAAALGSPSPYHQFMA